MMIHPPAGARYKDLSANQRQVEYSSILIGLKNKAQGLLESWPKKYENNNEETE